MLQVEKLLIFLSFCKFAIVKLSKYAIRLYFEKFTSNI